MIQEKATYQDQFQMVNLPFEKLLPDEYRASVEMSMSKNLVSQENSLNEQKFQ